MLRCELIIEDKLDNWLSSGILREIARRHLRLRLDMHSVPDAYEAALYAP